MRFELPFWEILVVTPWFFGGVWARVQWVLILLVGLLLAMDLVERFGDHDRPNVIPTLWIPLLAGILLGLFQLVPLSPGMASWLAPATARWRSELTSSPIGGRGAGRRDRVGRESGRAVRQPRMPRSLYALATREYLSLLILATSVLALASLHLVDRQSILWFCAGMAICGTLLSFFGLVQRLSWNGKFYWVFEPSVWGLRIVWAVRQPQQCGRISESLPGRRPGIVDLGALGSRRDAGGICPQRRSPQTTVSVAEPGPTRPMSVSFNGMLHVLARISAIPHSAPDRGRRPGRRSDEGSARWFGGGASR